MSFDLSVEKAKDIFNGMSDKPQSPGRYGEIIYGFNQLIHAEMQDALRKISSELRGVQALAIPGSDGRFEKGSHQSEIEIIALVDENVNIDSMRSRVESTLRSAAPHRVAIIEWKQFGKPFSFFNNMYDRVQPARIATDARPVWGDDKAIVRAREEIGKEVIGAEGAHIKRRVEDLERDSRKALTGKNRINGSDAVHFEFNEDGAANVFYNPKARQLSFKIGPLRLVQNTLLIESIKHIRNSKQADFFAKLRSNIPRRLEQLSAENMLSLSQETMRQAQDHYQFFLRMYHRSEQAHLKNKTSVLHLNSNQAEEVKRRLADLSQIMQSLKIGRK